MGGGTGWKPISSCPCRPLGAGPPFTTLVDPCCPKTGVTDIPRVAGATRSPELKLDLVAGLFDKGPRFEVNWEGTMLLKMRRKKLVFGEAPTTRQADHHFSFFLSFYYSFVLLLCMKNWSLIRLNKFPKTRGQTGMSPHVHLLSKHGSRERCPTNRICSVHQFSLARTEFCVVLKINLS